MLLLVSDHVEILIIVDLAATALTSGCRSCFPPLFLRRSSVVAPPPPFGPSSSLLWKIQSEDRLRVQDRTDRRFSHRKIPTLGAVREERVQFGFQGYD
ncbi:hypothetical protein U1Q18_049090 [Sarracenia purpurea var. burkii]